MRVFWGLDPGIVRVGLIALDVRGRVLHRDAINDTAKVKAGRLAPERLASITRRTQQSINKTGLVTDTNDVTFGLEEPFLWRGKGGGSNSDSLKTYGVFSVLSAALEERLEAHADRDAERTWTLVIVPPSRWHSWLGVHNKDQVKEAVRDRWGFEDPIHDVVDAYAIAQYVRGLRI